MLERRLRRLKIRWQTVRWAHLHHVTLSGATAYRCYTFGKRTWYLNPLEGRKFHSLRKITHFSLMQQAQPPTHQRVYLMFTSVDL